MKIDLNKHLWMKAPALVSLMSAIKRGGGEIRFVGGAVRDSLLGRDVQDIDLAVNLPPDISSRLLRDAGFKIIPIGIEYGTVMVVADGKSYEITSLRKDITTDGRHAVVSFTDNWQEDAQRRDFTINALYADIQGEVFDYVGGLADLENKRLRFIGKAQDRIHEDVLRILRYFRFMSQLGEKFVLDKEALEACRELAFLLPSLSGERLWKEFSKLLMGEACVKVVKLMLEEGLFFSFLPEVTEFKRFEKLISLKEKVSVLSAILRLSALIKQGHTNVVSLFCFSKKEKDLFLSYKKLCVILKDVNEPIMLRQALYDAGKIAVHGAILLLMAEGDKNKENLLTVIAEWEKPIFPLRGKDILALGVKAGPDIGKILSQVEIWWRTQDFHPDYVMCLYKAKEFFRA